jgi:hypothetical protein
MNNHQTADIMTNRIEASQMGDGVELTTTTLLAISLIKDSILLMNVMFVDQI